MRDFESWLGAARRVLRREPWWAEFWSAAVAIAWAATSFGGAREMDDWPSMQVLLRLGGEGFWSMAGLGLGLAQLAFLLMDHRWLRWAAAVLMCWFWAVLTVGVWAAVPGAGAPGVAVYAGWCGINVFSILRLMRAPGGPHGG